MLQKMVNLHKNTKLIRTKLFFVSKSHPFTLQVLDKPPVAVIEDMDDATSNALACAHCLVEGTYESGSCILFSKYAYF